MVNRQKAIEYSNDADVLIVGTGFTGATYAQLLAEQGFKVLMIDKRDHIAGNAYTERTNGIDVHKYGAHIFHTPNEAIWKYVNRFANFNDYRHKVIAQSNGKIYSLPFTLKTLSEIYERPFEPQQARDFMKRVIDQDTYEYNITTPSNLAEKAISLVGNKVYETLIRDYTKKQWNQDPRDLDQSIITRLPVRYDYNTDYFNDKYQGIPIDGYTKLILNMISDNRFIRFITGVDYFEILDKLSKKPFVIYTGPIDKYFDYAFGKLAWRSVKFETTELPFDSAIGTSVKNYCDTSVPYTRAIEHKYFNPLPEAKGTIVSFEQSCEPDEANGIDPYYPIDLQDQRKVLRNYNELKDLADFRVHICGRLGDFKYYDMHQAIGIVFKDFPLIKHRVKAYMKDQRKK
ncbi:UDP-galactopyranose mutase protein [Rhizobium phage RHph_I46]|uniref:UDP-galactopyranose mutase protein n=1 Tax=Rhizobium phage RHph_I1_9 TaxID=2509729 RepID=A0A7S5RDF7_9CAUD|nr:UDP-galactopyranose mutase protein [Rhizobium phage RHph_I1_9]QIG69573.1 UDP-galactopyranose mutase protein [Rhizobium phage RHph_I46]QIG70854.1 UDP-galactopyranose mutase protein [Rhizobium phage RHph_I9]QIG73441.1 UDP-galactopyranose mutase protein [Rhizobium phage RHph_I1_9]QIG76193.1 UDP-galactopyranose mutase protein [Rhizobium phage RHph_I34]